MRFEAFSDEREWQWFKERTYTIRCEDAQGLVVYDDQNQIQATALSSGRLRHFRALANMPD